MNDKIINIDTKSSQETSTFQIRKENCLGKRDKSNAGRIDPKAVNICAAINARSEYYTTSSCAGRCFLYCGDGIKSHHHYNPNRSNGNSHNTNGNKIDNDEIQQMPSGHGFFTRYRVNHDVIRDSKRYFNLQTLISDPDGGGDPIRTIGQFDTKDNLPTYLADSQTQQHENNKQQQQTIWLRFEPFILHVACRSIQAANELMNRARPAFKNVGLTSFKQEKQKHKKNVQNASKYIVAIWGDEGLDMPLSVPTSNNKNSNDSEGEMNVGSSLFGGHEDWLQSLVNERHLRNWAKIDRFTEAMRLMPSIPIDQYDDSHYDNDNDSQSDSTSNNASKVPKRYDVIGDVAIVVHPNPQDQSEELAMQLEELAQTILKKNKHLKMCVVRTQALSSTDRSIGANGLYLLAGPIERYPRPYSQLVSSPKGDKESNSTEDNQNLNLITSHTEYGIKCVVSLTHAFFSPRMGPERLRLCQQVARGENVLVLFSGCGMEALQIAGRTEANSVTAMELNPVAVECANRGKRMLVRNKTVKCPGAAGRVEFVQGDVLDLLKEIPRNYYERILAPRPKEGKLDGEVGGIEKGEEDEGNNENGKGCGADFLRALLPALKEVGGECHWYDFCADWELPNCDRTRQSVKNVCDELGLGMEVLHVASVGSIAKRQFRICLDFRLTGPL